MPVEKLRRTAKAKFEAVQRSNPSVTPDLQSDLLLLEMKEWFKTDFFSWVDSPSCPTCSSSTQSSGMCSPTPEEQIDGAGRVEGYTCTQCNQHVRFPRYHSKPEKLLETRKGRFEVKWNWFSTSEYNFVLDVGNGPTALFFAAVPLDLTHDMCLIGLIMFGQRWVWKLSWLMPFA